MIYIDDSARECAFTVSNGHSLDRITAEQADGKKILQHVHFFDNEQIALGTSGGFACAQRYNHKDKKQGAKRKTLDPLLDVVGTVIE